MFGRLIICLVQITTCQTVYELTSNAQSNYMPYTHYYRNENNIAKTCTQICDSVNLTCDGSDISVFNTGNRIPGHYAINDIVTNGLVGSPSFSLPCPSSDGPYVTDCDAQNPILEIGVWPAHNIDPYGRHCRFCDAYIFDFDCNLYTSNTYSIICPCI